MLHIPILRKGEPYRSVEIERAVHYRTREPFVECSRANSGLVKRDLLTQDQVHKRMSAFTTAELMAISVKAGKHFGDDDLPLGDSMQSPQQYVESVCATTGLPWVMVRRNMTKIRGVMEEIETVLRGLTRLPDLSVLDTGYGKVNGQAVSFFPRGDSLGVILPSNSPGVHALWVPAIAMKTPLILKPGSAEPWSPYRIAQAFIKAGLPKEVFGFYPTDHSGGGEILRRCGRGMLFGDVGAAKAWQGDPRIEIHGPGYSKIIIAEDQADNWEQYLDLMVESIVQNSGRSCVNASSIWVTKHSREIAEALAQRLAKVIPREENDPQAEIAPFANPDVARRLSSVIDGDMDSDSIDVTAKYREGSRCVDFQNCTYLLPTIIHVNSAEHALANREFLFPFASVVEVKQHELPEICGPTLVASVLTEDKKLMAKLFGSSHIGRLNIGPLSTMKISWDQPHEGNLFDHLYARRAFQMAS